MTATPDRSRAANFCGACGEAARVDELAGDRRGGRRSGGLKLLGHGAPLAGRPRHAN